MQSEVQKITSQVIIESFFGESFRGVKILNEDFCKILGDMINDSFEISFISPYFLLKQYFLGNYIASNKFLTNKEKQVL